MIGGKGPNQEVLRRYLLSELQPVVGNALYLEYQVITPGAMLRLLTDDNLIHSSITPWVLIMNVVSEIEAAVAKLSRDELSAFRDWFMEFDAEAWEKQLELDVAAGRLDALAEEALLDLREGRCTEL